MNLNLKTLLVLVAASLCSLIARSQTQDYVITANNDTISCKVSTSFLSGNTSYKVADGKSIRVKPEEIKEYYVASKDKIHMAMYREKKKKPEFFVVLEKGKIILLEGITTSFYGGMPGTVPLSSSSTQWYLSKGTDTVKEVKNSQLNLFGKSRKERKNDFEEMISDNTDVLNKYKAEDKFSFKQLRNLVHLYNTGQLLED